MTAQTVKEIKFSQVNLVRKYGRSCSIHFTRKISFLYFTMRSIENRHLQMGATLLYITIELGDKELFGHHITPGVHYQEVLTKLP